MLMKRKYWTTCILPVFGYLIISVDAYWSAEISAGLASSVLLRLSLVMLSIRSPSGGAGIGGTTEG